mmetsp:Transcript_5662/g.20606  ORF Transcript_5662/g.20606 Transcript_5662/m.20606 type:complete len:166 (-) Transcript_5662:266-763(-)
MATTSKAKFEYKKYDVTDCCGILFCHLCRSTLELESEEAVLTNETCCGSTVSRRPYGELGSVDISRGCGCCWAFNSSLSQPGPEGNNPPITPGFGCEGELVQEIVEELKARMKQRGDTAQIQRAEEQLDEIKQVQNEVHDLNTKLDAIIEHLNIQVPSAQPPMER